jgi:Na+/H+-dicarboxylate symporter
MKKQYKIEKQQISEGVKKAEEALSGMKFEKSRMMKASLSVEETLAILSENGTEDGTIKMVVRTFLGGITIDFSMPGQEFDIRAIEEEFDYEQEITEESEDMIRKVLLRSLGDGWKYYHKNGVNHVKLTLRKIEKLSIYLTLGALLSSILFGMLMKQVAPAGVNQGLNEFFCTPVKTMFVNALKMISVPVVFFSIASCLASFQNIADVGKIGVKVLAMYLFTTVIAIAVGTGVFSLIKPGGASLASGASEVTLAEANVSLKSIIVGIVPDNIIAPFANADMLQIIFLAVLCGIAVGMIGEYSQKLKELIEACNQLFLKITMIIVKVTPLAVFCSMTSLVLTTGTDTLIALIGFVATFILGLICMILVYSLLVLLIARLNPIVFLKKYAPTMLTAFTLSSSNAVMPFNMKTCKEELGISPAVYSFSIPMGATMNMDGTCVYLMMGALFLAKIYGMPVPGSMLVSMFISTFILSIGAPGVTGSAFICLSVLTAQIGLPAEAVSIVMGVDPIMSMFRTLSNCTGDAAVSLIVAKTENKMDTEVYYS